MNEPYPSPAKLAMLICNKSGHQTPDLVTGPCFFACSRVHGETVMVALPLIPLASWIDPEMV